jgi:cerevisin
MAYLLSIYPSKSFNPQSVQKQPETVYGNAYQGLLSVARATFPGWMTYLLPSPSFDTFAPVPKIPELTPAIMKKAVRKLSSPGLLSDIPEDTPNLLIFNNATALKASEDFWASLF